MWIVSKLDELIKSVEDFIEKANKPSRKEVWNQTVAFLAGHGDKGMQAIHQRNQAAERAEKPAAPKAAPKPPTDRPGHEGEVIRVKGNIVPKRTSYPIRDPKTKQDTGERGYRSVNVQEVHHFVHRGGKWEHSHTTHEGAGLNSKAK